MEDIVMSCSLTTWWRTDDHDVYINNKGPVKLYNLCGNKIKLYCIKNIKGMNFYFWKISKTAPSSHSQSVR